MLSKSFSGISKAYRSGGARPRTAKKTRARTPSRGLRRVLRDPNLR